LKAPTEAASTEAASAEKAPLRSSKLLVITTGGTFDKSYDVVNECFSFIEESSVPRLIEGAYLSDIEYAVVKLMDSWDMQAEHRSTIAAAIEKSPLSRIVVVHGTSTIIETANLFAERFGTEKTIVLTGALKPLRYDALEAACNFGAAICAARYFNPGVYVAMHGLVEPPHRLHKNSDTGRFGLIA
jgi:L-asparaginase